MGISSAHKKIFSEVLSRDSNTGFHQLAYYLKSIIGNRPIELAIPGEKGLVRISASDAWQYIEEWSLDNQSNLPMGDRGRVATRARRLLNYLELTIQGRAREAAAAHQAILESVDNRPIKDARPVTPSGVNLKKLLELRDLQYKLIQDKFLGKLETSLQKSRYLARFKDDPHTLSILSGLLSANSQNLLNHPNNIARADEVAQLIQYHSGRWNINNAAHLAYAESSQVEGGELDELVEITQKTIKGVYGDDLEGLNKFRGEVSKMGSLSRLLTLSQIDSLIDMVAPDAPDSGKKNLSHNLRSAIVNSLNSGYISPEDLLSLAASNAGIPANQLGDLKKITSYIEEIRYNEQHNTLTGSLQENNPRIAATLGISSDIGVSPHIPWLSSQDLDSQAVSLIEKYHLKETDSFSKIIEREILKDKDADFGLITDLTNHLSNASQRRYYKTTLSGNPIYSLRDRLSRTWGGITGYTQPVERFYERTNKHIFGVYDVLNKPFDGVGNWLINLQENYPIFNPGKFINDKLMGGQLWVAQKILDWSDQLKGTGRWYSGIFTQISDFTGGFIHSEAQWSDASFHFIQKKWGNILDWGAKKAGYAGFDAVKAKIGSTLWSGFSKLAPGLAEKLSAGALGKLVLSFTAGTLSAGTTILIQVGAMLLWEGAKGIWNFLFNSQKRSEMLARLPLAVWASTAFTGLTMLPGAIVGGVLALGSSLLGGIGVVVSSLATIFIPAIIVAGASVTLLVFINLWSSTTSRIDSSSALSQFVSNIVCDDAGNPTLPGVNAGDTTDAPTTTATAPNSVLSCATCLAKYLNECYGPSVNSSNISRGLSCMAAKAISPEAVSIIERSAISFTYLQCVGFVQASIACGGGSLPGANACSYANQSNWGGYTFRAGLGGAKPGDPIVFKSSGSCSDSAPGHIGILKGDAGALVCLVDANSTCSGCVSDNNCLPKTNVAGHLSKL